MLCPSRQLSFVELFQRLLDQLRAQIAAGSLTVRRLARQIGVSQPHMHNMIRGKRSMTIEMADRLLEFLQLTPLALATPAELGDALEASGPATGPVRYVPLAAGLLGPSQPFPDLQESAAWVPLPACSAAALRQPVFAELAPDAAIELEFPGAGFVLLETSLSARLRVRLGAWYAVRWLGGGWVRRLRYQPGRLVVLGQEGLRPAIGPEWIELGGLTADAYIRGLVVWIGGDPRRIDPLALSGYLMPPPAADS